MAVSGSFAVVVASTMIGIDECRRRIDCSFCRCDHAIFHARNFSTDIVAAAAAGSFAVARASAGDFSVAKSAVQRLSSAQLGAVLAPGCAASSRSDNSTCSVAAAATGNC